MAHESAPQDPLFVKISEDAPGGRLRVTPLRIEHGGVLPISGREYRVERLSRGPDGRIAIQNRTDDLRGNLEAYELLRGAGALPDDVAIDDLCVRNPRNGDCMIELCHNGPGGGDDDPLVQPEKRHFFARLDAEIINPHLAAGDFEDVVVRVATCMFGTKSVRVVTTDGEHVPLIERSASVEAPVDRIEVRSSLSIYEREILRRLISVVAILLRGGKVRRVVTAMPHGPYYGFLVPAAARGLITPDLMLSWFDHVDARVKMLTERFSADLRGVAPGITVAQNPLMEGACEVLRSFFRARAGRGPEPFAVEPLLAEVIEAMQSADPFARFLFDSGTPKPKSFRELADLTYAASNLGDMAAAEPRRTLVVGVYDPTENISWNMARKLRYRGLLEPRGLYRSSGGPPKSKLDTLSYVGIMPLEQVTFDVSAEYSDQHLHGAARLLAVQDSFLGVEDRHLISRIFATGEAGER